MWKLEIVPIESVGGRELKLSKEIVKKMLTVKVSHGTIFGTSKPRRRWERL